MRKREVERYRHRLEALLAAVVEEERRVAGDLAGPGAEELPDPADRATAEEVRARSVRLHDRELRLEEKVRGALARLEAGTFGRCTACGGPIPPERLRARPITDLCVTCKAEAEQREHVARA
ncbi:MAG: TraR/DksA C4-type zinc finger protein [Anaeromyxobacteraceae bacterium]